MSRQVPPSSDLEGLSPAVAMHLLAWYHAAMEGRPVIRGVVGHHPLPVPPSPVLDHLLRLHGVKILQFNAAGEAWIDASEIRFAVQLATAITERCCTPEQDDFFDHDVLWPRSAPDESDVLVPPSRSEVEPSPALPEPPPPPDIPEDCVVWEVTNEAAIQCAQARLGLKKDYKDRLDKFVEAARRHLPKAAKHHVAALDALGRRFPNFSGVIAPIRGALHLQIRTGGPVYFRPQLLLGPPGVGKTAFVQNLAEALGASFVFQSLAELSAGFNINGSSSTWSSSGPGLIANAISNLPPGKPLLLLFDELDKTRVNSNHPPDGVLLGLLEPRTARRYQDEYFEIAMDASRIMFVFTANRVDRVRPELLSRLTQSVIRAPSPDDMPAVVRSVDEVIRGEQPALKEVFAPLSEEVIAALAKGTPRQVRQALEDAYAVACEQAPDNAERIEITLVHLPKPAPARRNLTNWSQLIEHPERKSRH